MDLEFLRNFILIAETGNISSAAKKVSLAQPALSNQIKVLQEYFGTQLIISKRGSHHIELTDAGRVLLRKAKLLIEEERELFKEISDCSSGFSGTLRFSLSPSMSIWFINNYLTDFSRKFPEVNFELYEGNIEGQVENMISGKSEFCITCTQLLQEYRFETIYRRREPFMVFFHKESPYLKNNDACTSLTHLDKAPVCLYEGCVNLFLSVTTSRNIKPNILSVSTTKLSALAWAQANLGITVIPGEIEDTIPANLVRKVIMDDQLFMDKTFSIVKGRVLSNIGQSFYNYIKSIPPKTM